MATKGTEGTNNEQNDDILILCDRIHQVAFNLHTFLRHGHLEKVYENGLAHRLREIGMNVEQQFPLQVRDEDGTVLGEYFADMFVNNRLIIELKACNTLVNEHIAQVLGYLRASGCQHGLLINFGSPRIEIKKLIL